MKNNTYLRALILHNFRNFKDETVEFSPGINAFVGDNAQGKTNLLEAIALLFTGRSFRTHRTNDLIAFDAPNFYLEAHFVKNGIDQTLKLHFDHEKKRIMHNATSLPSLSALFGLIPGVVLSPEDKNLIKGTPQIRRRFLDLHLAQIDPIYVHNLSRYYRAMRQRNQLLKTNELSSIAIWEEEMATATTYITQTRQKALTTLSQGLEPLSIQFKSSTIGLNPNELREAWEKSRERECKQGTTAFGPHRDDLIIHINNRDARFFASEGEGRMAASSIRLSQWQILNSHSEERPLLCIDDVGISLDQKRRDKLMAELEKFGQVFVTSPQLSHNCGATIEISSGRFVHVVA